MGALSEKIYEQVKKAIYDLLDAYEFDDFQKIGLFEELKFDVMTDEKEDEDED